MAQRIQSHERDDPFAAVNFMLPESHYIGDPSGPMAPLKQVEKGPTEPLPSKQIPPKQIQQAECGHKGRGRSLVKWLLFLLCASTICFAATASNFPHPLSRNSGFASLLGGRQVLESLHNFFAVALVAAGGFLEYLAVNLSNREIQTQEYALRRNFAAWGGGASIIDQLTSPTHGLPRSTVWGKLLDNMFGQRIQHLEISRPVALLEDEIYDGHCWEFSGAAGQVGIQLPEDIMVSHIAINYISPVLLGPRAIARAPQKLTAWGLLRGDVSTYTLKPEDIVPASNFLLGKYHDDSNFHPSNHFIRLADMLYNISSANPRQEFAVSSAVASISGVKAVLIAVESNWGANTTCLYWIGVHGSV